MEIPATESLGFLSWKVSQLRIAESEWQRMYVSYCAGACVRVHGYAGVGSVDRRIPGVINGIITLLSCTYVVARAIDTPLSRRTIGELDNHA